MSCRPDIARLDRITHLCDPGSTKYLALFKSLFPELVGCSRKRLLFVQAQVRNARPCEMTVFGIALDFKSRPIPDDLVSMKRVKPAKAGFNPNQSSLDLIPVTQVSSQIDNSQATTAPSASHRKQVPEPPAVPAISEYWLKTIAFLMELFGCREDIYAEFWESQWSGKKGYTPKCSKFGTPLICQKIHDWSFDCKTCAHRVFAPLTMEVIFRHLTMVPHIGIYPLLPDHTCRFVVIDFDKKKWMTGDEWKTDALEFIACCQAHNIPFAVEVSRSGNGVHVWIFFSESVPALLARRLGEGLRTEAAYLAGRLKLDAYDRMIPNQDFLAKDGCGTVIAYPFQFLAKQNGRSIFVDPFDDFKPIPLQEQLRHLRAIRKLSLDELKIKISEVIPEGNHELGVPYMLDGEPHTFWRKGADKHPVIADLPSKLNMELGAGVTFDLREIPKQLAFQLSRFAGFPNPVFYIRQQQGYSTYGIPKVELRYVVDGNTLTLPRGCFDPAMDLLKSYGVGWDIVDRRSKGNPIDVKFTGVLREDQAEALEAMLQHNVGTLKAAPSFGKTVLGAAMIARRKVSTLIVVHRKDLARQWRTRLPRFLDIEADQIGTLGGPKSAPTGVIDIVMLATLGKMKDIEALTDRYGQVIVDECHHSAAPSSEANLNRIRALYFSGLSATPKRSDGRQPLVFMACGNVRFVSKRPIGAPQDLTIKARFRKKPIALPSSASWVELCTALVADDERTQSLIQEGLDAYAKGRHVILLTGRNAHVKKLSEGFTGNVEHLFTVSSDLSTKKRDLIFAEIEALPVNIPRIVVSTWQLIGEGFDHAPLNTLILCLPFSWEGTVTQCAGRLDRYLPDKLDAEIIDIIDEGHPIGLKMWKARARKYREIGYRVIDELATLDLFR